MRLPNNIWIPFVAFWCFFKSKHHRGFLCSHSGVFVSTSPTMGNKRERLLPLSYKRRRGGANLSLIWLLFSLLHSLICWQNKHVVIIFCFRSAENRGIERRGTNIAKLLYNLSLAPFSLSGNNFKNCRAFI